MYNILTLDNMKEMPIDNIIILYQQGYRLEGTYPIENLQCTTSITPEKTIAFRGDIIRFTATSPQVQDGTQVTFKIKAMISSRIFEDTIGTCSTLAGSCFIDWDTTGRHADTTYQVTAEVTGCNPTPVDIRLNTPPIKLEDIIFIAIVAVPSTLLAINLLAK